MRIRSGVILAVFATFCSADAAWTPSAAFQATTTNLVAYWPVDANFNASVGGFNGTAAGNAVVNGGSLPPPFGGLANTGSALLDGTGDCINLPLDMNLLNNVAGWTMAAWIDPAAVGANNQEIFSLSIGGAASTTSRAALTLQGPTAGGLNATGRSADADAGAGFAFAAGITAAGGWYHVAATLDIGPKIMRIYVNGALVGTSAALTNLTAATTAATNIANGALGANDNGTADYFNGRLDDLRIYSRVLTTAEVLDLARPRAPGLAAAGGPGQITLTITPNQPGAVNYQVFRRLTTGGTFNYAAPLATITDGSLTYVDPTAAPGTSYSYVVRAVQPTPPLLPSADSPQAAATAAFLPPRTNSHEEGLLGDKCSCGSSIPGGSVPAAALAVLAAAFVIRRRR